MSAGLLITGGSLIDGMGAGPRSDEAVLLRAGTITAVGQAAVDDAEANGVDERLDATGKTVNARPHRRAYPSELRRTHRQR